MLRAVSLSKIMIIIIRKKPFILKLSQLYVDLKKKKKKTLLTAHAAC